jgi:RHS repeat-associated protein
MDTMISRERDTTGNGTLDERVYFCHTRRGDTAAVLTSDGKLLEWAKPDVYGEPRLISACDIDEDGDVDLSDLGAINGRIGGAYDVIYDNDLDGDIDSTDASRCSSTFYGASGGRGVLSNQGVRHGYASYLHDPAIPSHCYVRHRWYDTTRGYWLSRDPLGYIDGMNLYQYVSGRPAVLIDPRGLIGNDVHDETLRRLPGFDGPDTDDGGTQWDDGLPPWWEHMFPPTGHPEPGNPIPPPTDLVPRPDEAPSPGPAGPGGGMPSPDQCAVLKCRPVSIPGNGPDWDPLGMDVTLPFGLPGVVDGLLEFVGVPSPRHCAIFCGGHIYSLVNRDGDAVIGIDNEEELPPKIPPAMWQNEAVECRPNICACLERVTNGNDGNSWSYSPIRCNSNWFAGRLAGCCFTHPPDPPADSTGWGGAQCPIDVDCKPHT